ncbi:MAG: hotdog fold thioesterase [Bacteroidia bacterium]|jgi:1,4-dihydroxy-2-naphthoyl-CoA hydrolase|nr:hotdog fold thioesterase [Bacteroidia bacterium]
MIWHRNYTIDQLEALCQNTIHDVLGIRITETGNDYLMATMPVEARTHQPAGILHGGASVVLAESLGSLASSMVIDHEKFHCAGLEVNANHIRSKATGTVTGKATPLHIGRSTHVWNIDITDEAGKRICIARLTVAILAR